MEKQNQFSTDNRGFSLMELIIALAISSMVILACYSFVAAGTQSYHKTRTQTKIQQEMMLTNNFIADVLMEASILSTRFEDTSNAAILYTDKYILYFNKTDKVFCMYESSDPSIVGTQIEEHLITDCMESFLVTFEETYIDDSDISLNPEEPTTSGGASSIISIANSHLAKVETRYKVKSTVHTSTKNYYIRN